MTSLLAGCGCGPGGGCSAPMSRHRFLGDRDGVAFATALPQIIDVEDDPNIVGDLSTWRGRGWDHTPGDTVLEKVNFERKRLYGAAPIQTIDPALHDLALYKAEYAAKHEIEGHIGGDQGNSTCEGVATTNGRFLSCCLEKRASVCGAAMCQGRSAWYCCFLMR